MSKPEPEKLITQIKSMQQEINDLQKALADLLDALIEEEKPGPKKIRELKELKKKALTTKPVSLKVKIVKTKQTKNDKPKNPKFKPFISLIPHPYNSLYH